MALFKLCTKEYTLPSPIDENGPGVTIPVGTPVIIPVYGIQNDEKYFDDPSRFNPDRFSKENKNSLTKCTYLAFGDGPRVCIGNGLRFKIVNRYHLSILNSRN